MSPKSLPTIRNISTMTVLFGIVLLCFIWVGLYYKVQSERQLEIDNAFRATANYARTFEEHTVRTFKGLDLIALSIKAQLEKEGLGIDIFRLLNDERFVGQPFILLGVLNEKGDLIANNSASFVGGVNNSDREFFFVHKSVDSGKLFIGKPVEGRGSGKMSIQLSRRINKPDGSFGGVVVVSADPNYFSDYYKQINLGEGSSIALVGSDGFVRVRRSGANIGVGDDFRQNSLLKALSASDVGGFRASAQADGVVRLYSYRTVNEYPLVVVAGLSEVEVLKEYKQRVAGYYWVSGSMSVVIALFVGILLKGISRRKQAEEELWHSSKIQGVLREIAEEAVVSQSMEDLYATIHRLIIKVLPAENFYITLLDEDNKQIVDGYSVDTSNLAPRRRPVGKGLTEYAIRLGRTVHVTQNEQERLRESGEAISQSISPICEWLGAPLFNSAGESFGVMAVVSKDPAQTFQPGDREILSIIAAQVSMAIERRQAENAVRSSQARYQALVEQSFEALAVVDIQTQEIVEVNRRFTEIFGYSLPEDAPLYVNRFVVENKSDLNRRYNITLRQQQVLPIEPMVFCHKNGATVPVERAGTVVSIEGRQYLLASMRDMTAERSHQAEMTRDVEVARRVQRELLPELPESPFVTIRTIYHSSNLISGDSFLLKWLKEGKLLRGFLMDVTGHGISTALQTASINSLLRETSATTMTLREQMIQVNSRASRYFIEGSYAAVLGFELDLPARELRYVGAGITQFYANGKKIETPGMFVGLWNDAEFIGGVIPISAGDCLHFLTDGFTDVLAQPENAGFWSPGGKNFDADVAALEKLAESGRLRDDATGVCLQVKAIL